MQIRLANLQDIPKIHELAHQIWPSTYQGILPPQQIAFMLNDMYSPESLQSQFNEGAIFLIAEDDQKFFGFASYSISGQDHSLSKIHKLYISPQEQGKGIGSLLLNFIRDDSKARAAKFLELNVNRNNPAYLFYKKYGFEVFEEVDIPYFNYVLNDYVMRLSL